MPLKRTLKQEPGRGRPLFCAPLRGFPIRVFGKNGEWSVAESRPGSGSVGSWGGAGPRVIGPDRSMNGAPARSFGFESNADCSNFPKECGSFASNTGKRRGISPTDASSLTRMVRSNATTNEQGLKQSHAISLADGILAHGYPGAAAERRITAHSDDQRERP